MRTAAWALIISAVMGQPVVSAMAQTCADNLQADATAREVIECLKQQQAEITALRQNSTRRDSSPPVVGNAVGGGVPAPATICPDGYYAVGINWWGSPGSTKYCIGCLSGIQVICHKLNPG